MSLPGVVIQFKADADRARKDIDKLTKSIEDVGDESKTSGARMSKLGKGGVAAVAAGAIAGAAALYDFAKAAAADWQESKKLARTLGNIPGITDAMIESNAKWIDSMEIATGFADTEFRDAIARLSVATGDLTKAQDLAGLAADVAAGRNKNLADIVPLLEKAYGGNTAALKRQMPWLDANKDGTLTFKEAVDGLTEAYGGAAEAAANNDPWKRIQAVWSQMKEALGQFILPFLEDLGDWFADEGNRKALQGWIDKVGEFSREIGEKLVTWVKEDALPALDELRKWFGSPEGKKQVENMTTAIEGMAEAVVWVGKAIEVTLGWLARLAAHDVELQEAMGTAGRSGAFDSPTLAQGPLNMVVPKRRVAPTRGNEGPVARGGPGSVSVTVINGRQEPSVDSAALGLRLARNIRGAA